MGLPDASRLSRLGVAQCAALAARLRAIELDAEQVGEISSIGASLLDPLRPPMRRWHLRRRTDPLAFAMRLLVFGDPITTQQARAALGNFPLERLLDCGLVVAQGDGAVVSPFLLNIVDRGESLYVVCDDLTQGEGAVMGAGHTTADLCNAAGPAARLSRALDLGCGAGTIALVVARGVSHVIGTDINPRAILLARFNAALNGISNVEFRQGDLFQPVAGETFELIVSQPPFVARPDGAPERTWLHGGRRGDELPLTLFSQLLPHLARGGRAVVLVEWPEVDDEPLQDRVRAALRAKTPMADTEANLLLLKAPSTDLDDYCTAYAVNEVCELGAVFEARAMERRDHLAGLRIRALHLAYTIVQRRGAPSEKVWTETVAILPLGRARVIAPHIDQRIATRDLLAADSPNLLSATLQIPPGVTFTHLETGKVRIDFPDLLAPVEVNQAAAMLVSAIHEAATVGEAANRIAASLLGADATSKVLAGVRQALELGILRIASP